jgi:CheY-like chemotaxis protein
MKVLVKQYGPSTKVISIQVVEDDPANLELMTELSEQLDAKVRPVGDSREAVLGLQTSGG